MKTAIKVYIGEAAQLVGTLTHEISGSRENSAFAYTDEWLADKKGFDLCPTLPRVSGVQFHRHANGGSVFADAIADVEPDGWGKTVIQRDWNKRQTLKKAQDKTKSVGTLNALDFLLSVDDISRIGALRLENDGVFQRPADASGHGIPPLIDIKLLYGSIAATERDEGSLEDLERLRQNGSSLGGMRPKCSVMDEDGRLCIGKFPSKNDGLPIAKGEVLALRLARMAGIRTATSRLVMSEGQPVSVIQRFDRDAGQRRHYLSARAMLGATRDEDHAYTEIADVITMHCAEVNRDLQELWRRIAFNILITNVDDHLNNHGFIHTGGGKWQLSPAFDLNPFPDKKRILKTWLSEDTGPSGSIEELVGLASYFHIQEPKQILADVVKAVKSWRVVAKKVGMTSQEMSGFAPAFEHEELELAFTIAGDSSSRKPPTEDKRGYA
jgi:serine/threonine-protein kinase HipA